MCTKKVPHQLIPSMAQCPVPPLHPLVELSRRGEVGGVEWVERHTGTPYQQWVPNPYPLFCFTTIPPQHQWTFHLYMQITQAWVIMQLHQSYLNRGEHGSFKTKILIFVSIANNMEQIFSLFTLSYLLYLPHTHTLKNVFFLMVMSPKMSDLDQTDLFLSKVSH